MAKKPETAFKEKFAKFLESLPGIWFFKTNEMSVRGIPDFIICIHGRFLAIELKAENENQTSALQDWVLEQIAEAGGMAIVCCPNTFGQVKKILEKLHEEAAKETRMYIDKDNLN